MKATTINHAVLKSVFFVMALCPMFISITTRDALGQTKPYGWAVGDGYILYTADGTDNNGWGAQAVPNADVVLNSVSAVDASHAWAVGDKDPKKNGKGTILFFNGTNWIQQDSGVKENLNSVFFLKDGQHGWAVGDNATILYTSNGADGKKAKWTPAPRIRNVNDHLRGVVFIQKAGHYYGCAVGDNARILYYTDKDGWKRATLPRNLTSRLNSVSSSDDGQAMNTVGDQGLNLYSTNLGQTWNSGTSPAGREELTVVRTFNRLIWVGQDAKAEVYAWGATKDSADRTKPAQWYPKPTGIVEGVWGMSLIVQGKYITGIWVVGKNGKIAYAVDPTLAGKPNWQPQRNPLEKKAVNLNGIAMLPPRPSGIKLDAFASPETAASGENYLSVTASGFPEGNITAQNVRVEISERCHEASFASTSAVSVVSASSDSNLISFLLPGGLAPGQYFVSISDSEEGDANFESSNCSAVNVAQ